MVNDLELKFHQRMLQVYDQAKDECGYKANRFLQLVNAEGGLIAAKRLLASKIYSEGLTRLWEEKRLDISMEATVLQEPWCQLFEPEELARAKKSLSDHKYNSQG